MLTKAVFKEIVTRRAFRPGQSGAKEASKEFKVVSARPIGAGKELTDEQLVKINTFAPNPLTKDQVYYVKLLMAHNGIDRDVERFSEDFLVELARTLPGKGFFVEGHPGGWGGSGGPGEGIHFDSQVEQMTPEEFKAITNEDIKLPDGITTVHALISHAYMIPLQSNSDTRIKIDGGIIRFSSIGFKGPFYSITDDNGNHIYGEYRPKGEALEGSLVWLGAQPGAGVMKGAKDGTEAPGEDKGAVAYSATTAADEARAWDAAAAKTNLAKWASSDGSGDKDKIDWPKYRKGFAWYDPEKADSFEGYKLPHHDVIDGTINVIWKGCESAMGVCNGAMGGVDIPEAQMPAVKAHLEKHYKQFGKEPPKEADNSNQKQQDTEPTKGDRIPMKILAERLSKKTGKAFTAENLGDEVEAYLDEVTGKMKSLEAKAADGDAYRDVLVEDAVHYGAMVNEIATTEAAQRKESDFIKTWPLARIKELRDKYEKMARKMYPDRFTIQGKEQMDRERQILAAERKQPQSTRKDLSTSQHNELLQ